MGKRFLTYDEQIAFLKAKKKLEIKDETYAKKILFQTGYFPLINGYKEAYKDPATNQFQKGVTFEDIYELYQFDNDLRNIFIKYILMVERNIKSSLSYHFCLVYGDEQDDYLDVSNYDYTGKKKTVIQNMLKIMKGQIRYDSDYAYIRHYVAKYNYVPLWVLLNVLTIGQLSKIYSCQKGRIQIKICQDLTEHFPRLSLLKRNVGTSTPDGYLTSLVKEDTDWLSGRWADNESLTQLYSISICLFYLALILEVTAAAVLSAQLLGDRQKRKRRARILYQLGTPERLIKQAESRLLFLLFLFPAIPALIIGSCFIFWSGRRLEKSAFHLPMFSSDIWILQAFGTVFLFFLFLYAIYYAAVQIAAEEKYLQELSQDEISAHS